jgi:Leucine-rich repeat (LRR) protein
LLLLLGMTGGCRKAPEIILVEIPDKAFRQTLLAQGVDSNGDGQISQEEAKATRSLLVPPSGIKDLTGLEAFIHLDSFAITLNPLDHIDLSALGSLIYLECTSCEITSLDVSMNTSLETLICGRNSLEELDLSGNSSLESLVCNNNLLNGLDLSANTGLSTMICCGNQLTHLDISQHKVLTKIGFDNMPMLTEVCVWTLPFPPSGVVVLREFSPNVVYTTHCSK